jgi:hypothetical protein
MTKTAKLIKDGLRDFNGHASLYRLSEPIITERFNDGGVEEPFSTHYVIVSSANVPFSGPETYIFPANARGNVVNWGELEGSRRGSYSHADVLRFAGYEIK